MLITTQCAAKIIGCTRTHAARLFRTGKLRGQYFGSVIQIEQDSAEQYALDDAMRKPGPKGPRSSPKTTNNPERG